jgi:Ca2+/Na+ antiporter
MIIIALMSILFATSFNIENISIAGSTGFLIIFALVNLANLLRHKETDSNRIIPAFGFLLCTLATVVLIGYHLIHKPEALVSSGIVVAIVILFTYLYYMIEHRHTLSKELDRK